MFFWLRNVDLTLLCRRICSWTAAHLLRHKTDKATTLEVLSVGMFQLSLQLLVATLQLAIIADATPAGFATFFRGSSCPSGWSAVSSAQGRLILTDDGTMSVGLTKNTVLGDREDRTHTHTVSSPGFSWPSNDVAGASWPGGYRGAKNGGYSGTTATTSAATSGYPFVQLLFCSLSAANSDPRCEWDDRLLCPQRHYVPQWLESDVVAEGAVHCVILRQRSYVREHWGRTWQRRRWHLPHTQLQLLGHAIAVQLRRWSRLLQQQPCELSDIDSQRHHFVPVVWAAVRAAACVQGDGTELQVAAPPPTPLLSTSRSARGTGS